MSYEDTDGDEVTGREVPVGKVRMYGLGREAGHKGLVGQATQLRGRQDEIGRMGRKKMKFLKNGFM